MTTGGREGGHDNRRGGRERGMTTGGEWDDNRAQGGEGGGACT